MTRVVVQRDSVLLVSAQYLSNLWEGSLTHCTSPVFWPLPLSAAASHLENPKDKLHSEAIPPHLTLKANQSNRRQCNQLWVKFKVAAWEACRLAVAGQASCMKSRQSGNEEGAAWGCSCTEWPSGETIPTQKVVTELWNWPHPASLNQQGVKEKFKRNARIQYSLMLHKKLFKNTVELKEFQTAGSWNSNSNKPFNFHCSQLSFFDSLKHFSLNCPQKLALWFSSYSCSTLFRPKEVQHAQQMSTNVQP